MKFLKDRGVESVGLFVSDALPGVDDAAKRVFANRKHQFCIVHLKRNILSLFPHKEKKNIAQELNDVIQLEIKSLTPIEGFKAPRNIAYLTYLEYPVVIQRMIYSTNWIERLNRDYKRVLKIRGAMPTSESVIAINGSCCNGKKYILRISSVCI